MGNHRPPVNHLPGRQDQILLQDFEVKVIVGILPDERKREQPLIVHITMHIDTERAALSGDLSMSVDYSRLANAVAAILTGGKFRLIESAAVAIARFILVTAPPVTFVSVELAKPKALGGHGIPHVIVTRSRTDIGPLGSGLQSQVFFECPGTSLRLYAKPTGHPQSTRRVPTPDTGNPPRFLDFELTQTLGLEIAAYEV